MFFVGEVVKPSGRGRPYSRLNRFASCSWSWRLDGWRSLIFARAQQCVHSFIMGDLSHRNFVHDLSTDVGCCRLYVKSEMSATTWCRRQRSGMTGHEDRSA
jgi:hypothetical protein